MTDDAKPTWMELRDGLATKRAELAGLTRELKVAALKLAAAITREEIAEAKRDLDSAFLGLGKWADEYNADALIFRAARHEQIEREATGAEGQ